MPLPSQYPVVRAFCLAVLATGLCATPVLAQWEIVTDTMPRSFNSVDFDDQFGVAVGRGVLMTSEDGGATWVVSDTSSFKETTLNGVVIDSTVVGPVAIVVGNNLTVLRSPDRGANWKNVHSGVGARLTRGCSLGSDQFLAVGDGGWLGESDNTGLTWETRLIFPAADVADSACLVNGTIWVAGFVSNGGSGQCCGVILKSDDLGTSWTKAFELTDPSKGHFETISFGSPDVGFATSAGRFGSPRSLLFKTIDGGLTWTQIGVFDNVNAIDFFDENTGAMVGDEGLILWTEDGGNNWVKHPSPTPWHLSDVILLDTNIAIAVGGSVIIRNETGAAVATEPAETVQLPMTHEAFPSPASTSVTISVNGTLDRDTQVRVVDLLGRTVSHPRQQTSSLQHQSFQINVTDLPAGLYMYRVTSGSALGAGTFVVSR